MYESGVPRTQPCCREGRCTRKICKSASLPISPSLTFISISQTNARIMSFRNAVGSTAVMSVQASMQKFKSAEHIEEYVKSGLIYYGEIPFLYRTFKPTDVPSTKEKGGYKVVSVSSSELNATTANSPHQSRHGPFQNQAIMDTMLIYYGSRGIKQYLPTASSYGSNPVGMLALVCTGVRLRNTSIC